MIIARIGFAALLAIAAMGPAQAVHLDIGGRGQVLLYPYYTVNNGQQTLVSVTNTSSVALAVKVNIREGYNGRAVLNFNVFLSPFDSWTATVFALRDAGLSSDGAAILSRDTSCTAPAFSEDLTSLADGTPYVALREFNYLFLGDGGPSTIDRTREGSIEIIAMANLDAPLAAAVAHGSNGSPPTGCAQVLLLTAGDAGVVATPSGGLMGSVSIINGGQGTYLSARAEALAGFTGVGLFSRSFDELPNLASVNDGAGSLASRATAHVFDADGKAQDLTYPGADPRSRRVDAVSAVLMADRIFNEYQISAALAAASDWVVTMPTKPFYTDYAYLSPPSSSAIPPFSRPYDGSPDTFPRYAPVEVDNTFLTRDGRFGTEACIVFGGQGCTNPKFGYVTNVFPVHLGEQNQPSNVLESRLITLPRRLPFELTPSRQIALSDSGTMFIALDPTLERHALLPSVEGKVLRGLPVIGFWASNIVNNNVGNGVLANYAAAVRHATSVTCVKASDGMPCD